MPYASPISGTSGSLKLSAAGPPASSPLHSTRSAANSNSQNSTTSTTVVHPTQTEAKARLKEKQRCAGVFDLFNDEDMETNETEEQQGTVERGKPSVQSVNIPQVSLPNDLHPSQIPQKLPLKRANTQSASVRNAGGVSKLSLNVSEILKFPKESTYAYSYANLSPNSLAVRLSVLKRSLEILLDRPDLRNGKDNDFGKTGSIGLHLDIESFINQVSNEAEPEKKINISSNASSAALSAFFGSGGSSSRVPKTDNPNVDENTDLGIKALIKILKEDEFKGDETTTKKTLAKNLHDLSLTTYKKVEDQVPDSESQLKKKLLYALATPFYESISQTPIISLNKGASTIALSSLANTPQSSSSPGPSPASNKFFHAPQRSNEPQAVFTCELSDPWNLKAANDLSCLIFGVSKNSLRRLTLLDLVSPDSRDFVFNRLIENSFTKNEMIFSGEIIAIAKSGNKLTWASLWAKKKGNLIICMFDQVPCDSVDLVINFDTFEIESSKRISGASFFNNISSIKRIDDLVNSFKSLIEEARGENTESNAPRTILDSQALNEQRYFTITKAGFKIPCAITSKVIDEDQSKAKLKIHTMPYIAGVFIISAQDYKLLSFNESISKNLFGLNEQQLINQPITKIVPNFEKIMNFILNDIKNLKIIPGLVLPEHFFRQMDCLVQNQTGDAFLNSIGLDGIHADGSTIKIDIQLRCPQPEVLVLWITHSRTVYGSKLEKKRGVTFKVDEQPKQQNTGRVGTLSKRPSTYFEDEYAQNGELPSQLSLLKEHEIQSISRSSSYRSNALTTSSATSSSTSLSTTSATSKQSSTSNLENIACSKAAEAKKDDSVNLEGFKVLDSNMSEEELLKIEEEAIQRHKSTSQFYPKKIGVKRREKTFKEFSVLKKMGQGAYGKVVLAENKSDPNYRVVIKLIIKERILVDTWVRDRKLGTIPSEIQIMATLNDNPHPNIMRLIDFFEDNDYYYIETPPHGFPTPAIDLFDLIELKEQMSEMECKSIIKQAVSALNHLHKHGVVHRDIKDENLIIDNNGMVKLIDFGSAAYIRQGPFDVFVGTLDYAAPEVLNGRPYDGKPQDVWSLGILVYTLIYKENPFYNIDEIMEGELRVPFVMSDGSLNLIKKILQRDIEKRPVMQDIIDDEWLNK